MTREQLEGAIAERFGRAHAVVTGSGASAIYTLLRARNVAGPVLYPDLTCETAINGALLLGLTPTFADIDRTTGLLAAKTAPKSTPEVVVATHLYGNLLDVTQLREVYANDVFILEDAAQGYGGILEGKVAGSFGDASIVSFGSGKAIDCGGGGAALMDDAALASACRQVRDALAMGFQAGSAARTAMMQEFFVLSRRTDLSAAALFEEKTRLKQRHRDAFVYQASSEQLEQIIRRLPSATDQFQALRDKYHALRDVIRNHSELTFVESAGNPVPWRTSFLCEQREALYTRLVRHGIAASRYFAPLHGNFGLPDSAFPQATWFAERIINLRIDVDTPGPVLASQLAEALSSNDALSAPAR